MIGKAGPRMEPLVNDIPMGADTVTQPPPTSNTTTNTTTNTTGPKQTGPKDGVDPNAKGKVDETPAKKPPPKEGSAEFKQAVADRKKDFATLCKAATTDEGKKALADFILNTPPNQLHEVFAGITDKTKGEVMALFTNETDDARRSQLAITLAEALPNERGRLVVDLAKHQDVATIGTILLLVHNDKQFASLVDVAQANGVSASMLEHYARNDELLGGLDGKLTKLVDRQWHDVSAGLAKKYPPGADSHEANANAGAYLESVFAKDPAMAQTAIEHLAKEKPNFAWDRLLADMKDPAQAAAFFKEVFPDLPAPMQEKILNAALTPPNTSEKSEMLSFAMSYANFDPDMVKMIATTALKNGYTMEQLVKLCDLTGNGDAKLTLSKMYVDEMVQRDPKLGETLQKIEKRLPEGITMDDVYIMIAGKDDQAIASYVDTVTNGKLKNDPKANEFVALLVHAEGQGAALVLEDVKKAGRPEEVIKEWQHIVDVDRKGEKYYSRRADRIEEKAAVQEQGFYALSENGSSAMVTWYVRAGKDDYPDYSLTLKPKDFRALAMLPNDAAREKYIRKMIDKFYLPGSLGVGEPGRDMAAKYILGQVKNMKPGNKDEVAVIDNKGDGNDVYWPKGSY